MEEVLHLLASGETTIGVGEALRISPKTVEYHRRELYDRIPEAKRDQTLLIITAVRHGYGIRKCGWCGVALPIGANYRMEFCCPNHKFYDWRDRNRQRVKATQKRYREKNAGKIKAYRKSYYLTVEKGDSNGSESSPRVAASQSATV